MLLGSVAVGVVAAGLFALAGPHDHRTARDGVRGPSPQARCRAVRVDGSTLARSRQLASRAGCSLRVGHGRLRDPHVQTVERERIIGRSIVVSVNPLCSRIADMGPPLPHPVRRIGRTGVRVGLYLEGGAIVVYSSPRCARTSPEVSSPGVVIVQRRDGTIQTVARVSAGRLAFVALAPGRYRLVGRFEGLASGQVEEAAGPVPLVVIAGHTTREDITAIVP